MLTSQNPDFKVGSTLRHFILGILFLLQIYLFQPHKGMDFTDEGHYLLSSDPYLKSDAWGWPYGWNLQTIFSFLDFSISNFRIFGVLALLLASLRLASSINLLIYKFSGNNLSSLERLSIDVSITTGSLFFYSGFLRTPNYNWLNVLGLILCCSAILRLSVISKNNTSTRASVSLEYILGLFIVLPAKPSSVGFMLFASFVALAFLNGLKFSCIQTLISLCGLVAFSYLAVLSKFWPNTVFSQISLVLEMPRLSPSHSLSGAIADLVNTPKRLYHSLVAFPPSILLTGIPFVALVARVFRLKRPYVLRVALSYYLFCLTILLGYSYSQNTFMKKDPATFNWIENSNISNSILLLIPILVYIFLENRSHVNGEKLPSKFLYFLGSIFLFALISIGFGSTSGIQGKLTLGTVFIVSLILIGILLKFKLGKLRTTIMGSISIFLVTLLLLVFSGSSDNPYRSEPLINMTRLTVVGNHNSSIYLPDFESREIERLRENAFDQGFKSSTPTINLVYPSGIGFGYALGGRQSPTIQFAWFGYSTSLAQSVYLVKQTESRFDYKNAWVLVSPTSSYSNETLAYKGIISKIQKVTGLEFPTNYVPVYRSWKLELWKPK
jgi:hypothetical protein